MWNQDNQSFAGTVALDAQHTDGGRGWLGRVGGGCDYQFWQKFVVGALADYDFASLKGNMTAPFSALSGDEKMNWAWAAGGRVGYLPWDTLLVYMSGGYTQAHFDGTLFLQGVAPSALSTLGTTYSGWFLGSGYEYRFDWLPGLYWRTEYRFNSYNSKDNILFSSGVQTGDHIHSESSSKLSPPHWSGASTGGANLTIESS
jgi:outer membrane immunogenic protein